MFDISNIARSQLSGNLELLAHQVVEGFIIGLHKSPFHGFSVEFSEHRLYNPGEATKDIDWKVYARTDKLFVKRFEEETNLRCQIVIDASSSMYFPKDGKDDLVAMKFANKLRFSAVGAAALMNLLRKQRDAFGLSLFSDELEQHTHCKSSTTHYRLLLGHLDNLVENPKDGKISHLAKNLHLVAEGVHRRSLVCIFTDMFTHVEDNEAIYAALQHLKHNRHEVILFNVIDKAKELDFEYENRPYIFVDMESGEKVRLQSNQVKDLYRTKITEQTERLKMTCLQYGIDFIEADINQGFDQILMPYLLKRSKMRV